VKKDQYEGGRRGLEKREERRGENSGGERRRGEGRIGREGEIGRFRIDE
jgi:hypothetical protein